MIRRKTGFKGCAVLGVLSVSLIAVACSDDDVSMDGVAGSSGKAGSSSTAGSSGKAGSSSTAGSSNGGSSAAGSSNGGTPGTGGTSAGNAGTSAGTGAAGAQNAAGNGGDSAGAAGAGGAGEGGEPSMPQGGEGGATTGGAGGEGGAPFVPDVLDNPGFEVGTAHADIPGWTNEGTANAAYIEYSGPHSGFGKLGHWTQWVDNTSPPYTARTFQTVSPIANGTYSFSIWVQRNWFDVQYLFATGFNADDMNDEVTADTDEAEAPDGYVKITLSGIEVTSGSCTVGVYSGAPAGTFANFDDAELTLE
jgi:hypothetical protein